MISIIFYVNDNTYCDISEFHILELSFRRSGDCIEAMYYIVCWYYPPVLFKSKVIVELPFYEY